MGKPSQRKQDKKRKAQKADRAARVRRPASLAYHGGKYRTEGFVPWILSTETAIHEADVMFHRNLTDLQVERALESLIQQMRRGPLPPVEDTDTIRIHVGEEENVIIFNIRRGWQYKAQQTPLPGQESLIGVLRTILASIENRKSANPNARNYLDFVEGFLRKLGVTVELVREEASHLPSDVSSPAEVDQGLRQLDAGQGINHEEAKTRLAR